MVNKTASEIRIFDQEDVQTGIRAQLKVVDICLTFSTPICTPHSNNHSQSYSLHGEQRSEHIKYGN